MPNKYAEKKGWELPKQKYKISNWTEYTQALRDRGNIEVWISDEAISNWYLSGFVRGANLALKLRCRLDLTASVRVCQQMGQGSPSF